MDKIERLICMMEHPDAYSEAEWQEMLADDDCRATYELMSKTDSAMNKVDMSVEDIDREWRRFEATHIVGGRWGGRWQQIAAVFAGLLLVSGLAIAAVSNGWLGLHWGDPTPVDEPTTAVVAAKEAAKATQVQPLAPDTVATKAQVPVVKQYEDAKLGDIMADMGAYYHVQVVTKNEQAARLRLFFKWNQADGLDAVVEQLNNFEQFTITVENRQLIVE